MFKQPDQKPNFSDLELALQQWWKDKKIYEKSVEIREGAKDYIFYDGPPFMSGMPHYATLLSSLPKDVIPRYQTMQGRRVERLWGWDCHGLPIENKVEEQLGLNGRREILEHGLEDFINKCYEWNRVGIENWRWYIDKIGRWADLDNAYRTMDQDYMESVWWSFKEMWDKGLVYKGKRTSLFSTDSSTPVSNFEVTMDPDNYRDTEDTAVTVKFELDEKSLAELNSKLGKNLTKAYLLSWTTTPWTLPSNFALALKPDSTYSVVIENNEAFILIKSRVEAYYETAPTEVDEIKSNDLSGLAYKQLYTFLPGNDKDFHVYLSEYVTEDEGTGVLHIAPAFGEVDFEIGQANGLSDTADIDDAGKMTVGPWQGIYIRKASEQIAEDLKANNTLFKVEKYTHRLPYYRYKNPLIYKTQENYFLNVQSIKEQLLNSNESINWVPEYFKEGRFKYVLETAPDWSISRSRFWGTVMPIWQSASGKQIVIGSRDELMALVNATPNATHIRKVILKLSEKSGSIDNFKALLSGKEDTFSFEGDQQTLSSIRNQFLGETETEANAKPITAERAYYLVGDKPLDMHRPFIDEIKFTKDGEEYTRIPETLDVWMDSGSMPFAQFHYPFENKEKFEQSFPGDFIAEYTGQIRAWFYVLHVISNSLFDSNAFKNVLVTGVMAGTDGRKMSKSFKNYPDPKDTLLKYGGDALRMYLLGSPVMLGNDINFSEEDIRMQVQEFLLPLWNCFSYLTTYANMHHWEPRAELAYNQRQVGGEHPWDHIPFTDLDNELNAWIIMTLQNTIGEVTAGLDSYDIPRATRSLKNFVNELSKWYIRRSRDRFASGDIRVIETLYYVLVEFAKLAAPFVPFMSEKIYQTLVAEQLSDMPESVHLTDYPVVDTKFMEEYASIVPEMNVVRIISEMGQTIRTTNALKVRQPLAKLEVQFSLEDDTAGLTLTPWMSDIIAAELNVLEVIEVPKLAESDTIKTAENTTLGIQIGLETSLTPELAAAGMVREVIRAIQALRKTQGLQMGQTAAVTYSTDSKELAEVIEANLEQIKQAVSAATIQPGEADMVQKVNDHELKLKVEATN